MELSKKAIDLIFALVGHRWMYVNDANDPKVKDDYMDAQGRLFEYVSQLEAVVASARACDLYFGEEGEDARWKKLQEDLAKLDS